MLSHRWCKTVSFFGDGENKKGDTPTKHNYDYGLINQEAFQNELLKKCKGIEWLNETAKDIKEKNKLSEVICFSGLKIKARLVIDASGHKSNFVKRPVQNEIAQQAAQFRLQKRAGMGLRAIKFRIKDDQLVCLKVLGEGEELLLVTEKGVIVRTNADKISQQSRAATGVKLQRLDDGDHLSEVVLVPHEQIEGKDQPGSVEQN